MNNLDLPLCPNCGKLLREAIKIKENTFKYECRRCHRKGVIIIKKDKK